MSFSIKQKLILVVTVAILGFAIQGIVSFSALNKLHDTSTKVAKIQGFAQIINETQLDAFSISLKRTSLAYNKIAAFEQAITFQANNHYQALSNINKATDSEKLKGHINQLSSALSKYHQEMSAWLEIKKNLGIDKNSGVLAKLRNEAKLVIEKVSGFAEMEQQMQRVIGAQKEHLNSSTPATENTFPAAIDTLKELIIELDFTEMLPAINQYQATYQIAFDLYKSLKIKESLLINLLPTVEDEALFASKYIAEDILPQAIVTSENATLKTRLTLLFSAIGTAAVIVLLLLWAGKSINRGLSETIKVLGQIAKGNFTYSMKSTSHENDEFSRLIDSVNSMAVNLQHLVKEADNASAEMTDIASGLSSSTSLLAKNNEKITDQTSQLASASEQMSVTANEVALTTNTLNIAATETSQASNEGALLMHKTDDAINQVSTIVNEATTIVQALGNSAKNIGNVVDVIDEIAAQTNLLALNAAIEAARAGESGRGFAVVADEVRDLAAKTVLATTKITSTVTDIQQLSKSASNVMEQGQEAVKDGVNKGVMARDAIDRLSTNIEKASAQTAQIATAIEQMSVTINDTTNNIEQVAIEVGSSKETAEKIAFTAGIAAKKAKELKCVTGQFSF